MIGFIIPGITAGVDWIISMRADFMHMRLIPRIVEKPRLWTRKWRLGTQPLAQSRTARQGWGEGCSRVVTCLALGTAVGPWRLSMGLLVSSGKSPGSHGLSS